MNLFEQIIFFCKTLSADDYIFFFAVVVLVILIVSLIYLLKAENAKENINELELITKKIENEYKPQKIEFSDFEKEQEEEAIISYEELLKNNKKMDINYETETIVDGLTIQKVDNEEMFFEVEDDFVIDIKK